jgi:hypothetical protein
MQITYACTFDCVCVLSALCKSPQHGLLSGTECVIYTWVSDSSLLCRTPPGLGQGQHVTAQAFHPFRSSYIPVNFYSLSVMRADVTSIATGDAHRCTMHRMRPIRMRPKSPHAQVKNQARSLSRAFSYDLPVISSIPLNILPASGGSAIFIYGTSFGVFACNRSWCSKTHVAGLPVMFNGLCCAVDT